MTSNKGIEGHFEEPGTAKVGFNELLRKRDLQSLPSPREWKYTFGDCTWQEACYKQLWMGDGRMTSSSTYLVTNPSMTNQKHLGRTLESP